MDAQIKQEIEELVKGHPVVLFMKGSKNFPQCGFSATVVNILRQAGVREFKDINVLSRPEIRDGVKDYANWPTIPQLYVKGEFVGGCDIVKELFASGELFDVLGTERPQVATPKITLSAAARTAVVQASEGESGALRIEISPQFEYALSIDEKKDGDFVIDVDGLTLLIDRQSATRADGLSIDFVETGNGGFKLDNPNEPPRVLPLSVRELKALLDGSGPIELFDVRTEEERAIAKLPQAQHFDEAAQAKLARLERDTVLYFHCHHGGRSQQAAEHYLRQGFKRVYNVIGGIDAWAVEIDASVRRY
jgi:monothiol glutaredoxin